MNNIDYKIENGDWVYRNDSIDIVRGVNEIMGHVEARLYAKKGKFYPNKDFGSLLFTLKDSQDENRDMQALQYARQALSDMPDIFVEKATVDGGEAIVTIIFDGSEKEVIIKL